MNRTARTRSGSAAIACAATLLLCSAPGQAQPARQVLHGHVRPAVSSRRAAMVGSLPPTRELGVSIVLPLRNQDGLTALLAGLYDPSSPNYHRFLTVEQFTGQFGPTAEDYQRVVDFARSSGLTVTDAPANRLLVPLRGTVAQIERAFNVSMKVYQHPTEHRTFFSLDREPSLDLDVKVAHIAGLNDYSTPRPLLKLAAAATQTAAALSGSGPGGAFLGSDMRTAYYGGSALTGSGQVVALAEFDGYSLSDVNLTFSNAGQSYSVPIQNVLLDGTTGGSVSGDDTEEVLDIVQAIGMAPGLSQVRVYIGSSETDVISAIAAENMARQVSISWTWLPEDPAVDDFFFQEMAAQGQSVFAASGDSGSFDPAVNDFYPAEDAFVTAVGGTTLVTSGAGGSWSSETAWSSSGGGISPDGIAIPSWQANVANGSNGGSTTLRNVPDVAMEADYDNYYCVAGKCGINAAGTSFAAPRWAGFMALVNQQAAAAGNPPAGFINPAIYNIGESSTYNNAFHDITIGNNNLDYFGVSPYYAAAGYDLVTGWGSPAGQSLINALAPPAGVGFRLSASAASLTINPGNSATTTLSVTDLGGFSGSVNLAVSGLPGGVTAAWGANPTAGTSALTLTVDNTALRGSYLLPITGTSGAQTATASVALEVNAPGFTIAPSPSLLRLHVGESVQSTIYVTNYAGFSGAVNFAVTTPLPSGVTAVWNTGFADGSAELMLTASSSAVSGANQMLTIVGTSGTLTATATVSLTVYGSGFMLMVSPPPYYLVQGSSISTTVTMVASGAFTDSANLWAPSLPSGVTATFNPVTISPGGTSVLTLTTASTAPVAFSMVVVRGDSGCSILCFGENGFEVVVTPGQTPDFSIATSPVAVQLTQGGTATTSVTVNQLNGFAHNITLSVSGLQPGLTASFSNNVVGSGTVTLTLSASNSTLAGPGYVVYINGDYVSQYGDTQRSGEIFLQVNPRPGFALAASPASLSVLQGSSASSTIAMTPQPGFSGPVTLSAYGLPSGVTAQFGTNPITGTSVVTLTASASATPGNYSMTIAGTSGTLASTVTLPLTVNGVLGFSLSANPSSLTMAPGATAVSTVTVTGSSGLAGVTLAASNLPLGVTASFSPNPATLSSTLTLTASPTATQGATTVTIAGTAAGALPETTTLGLLVTPTAGPANEWAWMSGSRAIPTGSGLAGIYGSLGVPATGNMPGGRSGAASWMDSSGNLWFFGGVGYDANANSGPLNDLWKFSPSSNQWAWMGGSSTIPGANTGNPGVYGVLGVPAAGNIPGGRISAGASWTDSSGHFWFFGGSGYDANGTRGQLNDMWEFDPSTNQWAWMGGSSTVPSTYTGHPGVYGVLGVPAPGNIPGGRYQPSAWTDASGHLWLFGGWGYDANGSAGSLNDMWEFNPSTNQWAWMSGTNIVANPYSGQCGHFGTIGIPATGNIPGNRQASATWTDRSGNLWLFGGSGCDIRGMGGPLNDLWEFSPSTNEWAWMSGSSMIPTSNGRAGTYGSLGVPAAANIPGGRQTSASWTDGSGNLWLLGGYGNDAIGYSGYLNDLWVYSPFANQWTWMGGSSRIPAYNSGQPGVYGTLGMAAPGNIPGGRQVAASWTDGGGNFWLSGGYGYDANGVQNSLNDLWKFTPGAPSETGFVLASSPGSLTIAQGASGTSTISVSGAGGFTGSVTLAASGLPSGVTATFSPNPTTGTSLVTLTVSSSAAPGSYSPAITGTSGTQTATAGLALRVTPGLVSSATMLGSSANPSTLGQSVTFTAAVSPSAATGTVQFLDGSTPLGTATIASGSAVLALSTLTVGAHSITAVYSGDARYAPSSSAAFAQTVNKTPTALGLASSANPSNFAQPVTLTATVLVGFVPSLSASGTVQFLDGTTVLGTAPIANGSASLTISTLTVGAHSITAVYSGDGNDLTSTSAAVAQTVNQLATTVTLTSSANPSTYGQSVTLGAAVAPVAATGTVQFLDGTTALGTAPIANGSASLAISTLTVGAHSITAVYSGDGNDLTSTSAAVAQTVNKVASSVVLNLGLNTSNPSPYAQFVSFSAVLTPSSGTGTMQFLDGTTPLATVTVPGNGIAVMPATILPVGVHSITAVYGGDATTAGSTSIAIAETINQAQSAVNWSSSPTPAVYGQPVTLAVSVSPTAANGTGLATGTMQFMEGATVLGTAPLGSTGATLIIPALPVGTHNITAVYGGDANFIGGTSLLYAQVITPAPTSVVLASAPNPSIYGQTVTLTAAVTPAAATGTVQFLDGATSLGTAAIAGGSAVLTDPTLTAGTHSVTAVYGGSTNYATSTSAAIAQTVNKTAPILALASSPNPSVPGQAVTLTAIMNPAAATGTVQFLDGSTSLGTVTIAGGSATLTVPTLAVGSHPITAVYSGDANYLTATAAATQTVNQMATSVTLASSANPSAAGQPVMFTATLSSSSATGTVQFLDGATALGTGTIASGSASLTVPALAVGTHSITAVYSGDANYLGSTSAAVSQTVNKMATSVTLASSANPSAAGQAVMFTATLSSSSATGTVQFLDGATSLGTASVAGGSATLTVPTLAVGTHSITAVYGGDANYLGSTSAAYSQTVNKMASSVTLASSANPSAAGQAVMFTATLSSSSATGTVQFLDGATSLGTASAASGSATLTVPALAAGTHSITAVYSGDANYLGSTSAAVSQTVNKMATSVTLASSLNPSTYGQSVSFTATLSSSSATGTVQFLDGATALGTATIASGSASLTVPALAAGTHSITAVYSGDANYLTASSAAYSQTVNKVATSVTLASSLNPSAHGQSVTFTAAVTPVAATGTVQFLDGATALGTVTIASGSASLAISTLAVGSHSVKAVYSGDANDLTATSAAVSQTINKAAASVTLASSLNPSPYGQSVTFTAAVTPAAATGTVQFLDGSTALGTVTIASGSASLAISTLAVGSHSITAIYSGDANDNTATSAAVSQTVSKVATSVALASSLNPATSGQSVKFTATVSPAAATGTVQFLDGTTSLGTVTIASGSAALTLSSLTSAAHSITAVYSGATNYATSTSAALNQIVLPVAPTKLTATAASSSQINLTWTASSTSGVTYNVYSSTASGFTPSAANRVAAGVTATSYSNTGLAASTTYYYVVTAQNSAGESAASNQANAATPAPPSCHVTYSVTSQWTNGFGTALTIKNTGTAAISGWNLTWTWPGNQQITQSWNANYTQTGANASLTNESYNASIAAGATITGMGFNASFSGTNTAPAAFYLNGTLCK